MQPLSLPTYEPRLSGDKIFCLIRRKWVTLTPEEWVRQHFLNLLIEHLEYPGGMMRLEHGLKYHKMFKRSDITVLDSHSKVYLLIECKAPDVPINQKVVNQVAEYNKILDSQFVAVSNGIKHFIWRSSAKGLQQIQRFPSYQC